MTDQSPPTVYVVCQAEYDAHGPIAAFTNAAAAEQHAADLRDAERGHYDVQPLPFIGHVPQCAVKHIRAGRVCGDHGVVEDEQTWTVNCWDYTVPAQPVVTVDDRHPDMPRVHVLGASAEAVEAAFRDAVEKVRDAAGEAARS